MSLYFCSERKHIYKDEVELPSPTRILKKLGYMGDMSFVPEKYLKKGELTHKLIESGEIEQKFNIENIDFEIFNMTIKCIEKYNLLKKEFSENHKYVDSEKVVAYGTLYGGIVDQIWEDLGGGKVVVEIKSGGRSSWHSYQTAAYMKALDVKTGYIWYLNEDTKSPKKKIYPVNNKDIDKWTEILYEYFLGVENV